MFTTGTITAINPTTSECQVTSALMGVVTATIMTPLILGSDTVGVQYMPKINDVVFLENTDNHHTYIVGTYIVPTKLQQQNTNNPNPLCPLVNGDILVFSNPDSTRTATSIKIAADGNIYLYPGSINGVQQSVIIGGGATKKVALDGDAIVGTDSNGLVVTGHVIASSHHLKSN